MEGNKEEYIRVGTCLYKIAQQPLANGTCTLRRIPWSFGTIRQDYGKNNTPPIRKYDGFCTVPSHTDYHKEIGGFYNLYEPIDHIPSEGGLLKRRKVSALASERKCHVPFCSTKGAD